MLVLIVTYEGKPNMGDAFEALMKEYVEKYVSHEPKTLIYQVNRSLDNPDNFQIIEHYENEEAMNYHCKSEGFALYVENQVVPMLASRVRNAYRLAASKSNDKYRV
jgi:quinol monooxygenase YgiN